MVFATHSKYYIISVNKSNKFIKKTKAMKELKLISSGIEVPMIVANFPWCLIGNKVRYYFGDGFRKYALNPFEKVSAYSAMSFDKHRFTGIVFDSEIMEHFQISKSKGSMTQEEILRVILYLTGLQPKGKAGILQTNGYRTIIGYMRCYDRVVRVVEVDWYSYHSEWRCSCSEIGHWHNDHTHVLSRN